MLGSPRLFRRYFTILVAAATLTCLGAESGDNCTFRNAPDDFLDAQRRAIEATNSRVRQFPVSRSLSRNARIVEATELRWNNFIDRAILEVVRAP